MANLVINFPFTSQRCNQTLVLNQICDAFNSGYKHIVLEAPTGFGKSPVAITTAMTLGSSYICTSTKDLQTQYSRDFPYLKVAKGKNNFPCLVKQDFIRNGLYQCGICVSDNANECYHTSVEYDGDALQIFNKHIASPFGVMVNYGGTKEHRLEELERRKKAWSNGLNETHGWHLKEWAKQQWLWDKESLEDINDSIWYELLKKNYAI